MEARSQTATRPPTNDEMNFIFNLNSLLMEADEANRSTLAVAYLHLVRFMRSSQLGMTARHNFVLPESAAEASIHRLIRDRLRLGSRGRCG